MAKERNLQMCERSDIISHSPHILKEFDQFDMTLVPRVVWVPKKLDLIINYFFYKNVEIFL
jgi:hypothetical protein